MCNCKGWDIAFWPDDEITVEQHFCRVLDDCGHVDNTLEEAADQEDTAMASRDIGNLCCEIPAIRVDADGYTIWAGGNYRPIDKDVVVAVKVRGKIPRDPVPAGMWPQICWMHRHADDEMNIWDIIAYKVLK
jgi:hypothetical protein